MASLTQPIRISDGTQITLILNNRETLEKENAELKNEVTRLRQEIRQEIKLSDELRHDADMLREKSRTDDLIIKQLTEENELLKKEVSELKNEVSELKNKNKKFDALVRLNECNALVNGNFKIEYRRYFHLDDYEYSPNVGDFISKPPIDGDKFLFWRYFNERFPNSDDLRFRELYKKISRNRADIVHVDIGDMTKEEFKNLILLVYPEEYNANKKLYDDYGMWLFQFPAIQ